MGAGLIMIKFMPVECSILDNCSLPQGQTSKKFNVTFRNFSTHTVGSVQESQAGLYIQMVCGTLVGLNTLSLQVWTQIGKSYPLPYLLNWHAVHYLSSIEVIFYHLIKPTKP